MGLTCGANYLLLVLHVILVSEPLGIFITIFATWISTAAIAVVFCFIN